MQRLIVVGASHGGVQALRALASGLPADLPCAVLVVLHVGAHRSLLPELMATDGPLPVHHARGGERLEAGRILVAPPDHHMLVLGDTVELTRGPKAHHSRPAIDPLFVSAALSHGPGVVGVILTGMLDDGTAGLQAVKRCGGLTVVQDPDEALAPSMPRSALAHVAVHHRVGMALMPALLARLAKLALPAKASRTPHDLRHELALTRHEGDPMKILHAIGKPSSFACPDCHGGLWKLDGERPERFRCHTGHFYTLRSLQHAMSQATDGAMWNALRALEEKQMLLDHMVASTAGDAKAVAEDAAGYREAASRVKAQVDALREVIERTPETVE
jgi:two-component system, chemotaxis family, protein-glutamate methylesterase/glutaminase